MTEMTFRALLPGLPENSLVGNWWHSVDRWVLGAVLALFAVGMVLGLAASPPLAHKNDLWTYHYVVRHAFFAVIAFGAIALVSMLPVRWIRRLGVVLCLAFLAATALLPWLGADCLHLPAPRGRERLRHPKNSLGRRAAETSRSAANHSSVVSFRCHVVGSNSSSEG